MNPEPDPKLQTCPPGHEVPETTDEAPTGTGRPGRAKRRRLALVLAGALLVAGAWACRHFLLSDPIGTGPAGPAVPREAFSSVWTARKSLLVGVGDSITDGYGSTEGHSYFERLVSNPPDEFEDMRGISLSAVLPNLRARNIAVSGSTSLDHLQHLRALEPQPADTLGLVVMTTGGNDLIHDYGRAPPREGAMYGATLAQARPWIAALEERLHAMFDLLEERFPGGCLIFLADIYDPTDGVGDIERAGLPPWPEGLAVHRAYNEVIRRCAAERASVHLVPMYGEFLGHGIHFRNVLGKHYRWRDPHYWYYSNIEDPNDRGYDAIRRLFLIEMAKVIPRVGSEP